jgi:hypothetical protein
LSDVTNPAQLMHWFRSAWVVDSPWERIPMDVPATAFGQGSRSQFTEYFSGDSLVAVSSVEDIIAWLGTCEYVSDLEQFHERDVWQRPSDFERVQRGDCEDFALWAWRKLIEIGVDAEFFVGRVVCSSDPPIARQHAWIVYRSDDEVYLFEPAARDRPCMIQPWSAVKDDYIPHFAVNGRGVTSAFVGCLSDQLRRRTA